MGLGGLECFDKLLILLKFGSIHIELFLSMQISFFAKVVLFIFLYCISDMSIKKNILKNIMNKANRARRV